MGFGGPSSSLLMSKQMAKWSTSAVVINQPRNADEAWIVNTVQKFADKAGIAMPGRDLRGEPNAFATGATKTLRWWRSRPPAARHDARRSRP